MNPVTTAALTGRGRAARPVDNVRPLVADALFAGPAVAADAAAIARLLAAAAPDTIPVPADDVARRIDEYEVVRHPRLGVVAATAVHAIDDHRSELRSVVVGSGWGGRGLGARLVRRAVRRTLAENRWLACVTLRPGFFSRLGFVEVPLDSLPEKPHRDAVIDGRRRVAMIWAPAARRAA